MKSKKNLLWLILLVGATTWILVKEIKALTELIIVLLLGTSTTLTFHIKKT